MSDDADDAWKELARREPYFAVLTDRSFLRSNLDETTRRRFFESGEADVDALLATVRSELPGFTPRSALDFGCGVGRLTIPLARRMTRAVGCDVAQEMLEEAETNARSAKLTNVRFVDRLTRLGEQRFDLVCSLIVFQHIPPRVGLEILTQLLRFLAPGGVAAIHFVLRRPGSLPRRLGRQLRARLPFVHRALARMEGDDLGLPYMQMNAYDGRQIVRRIIDATGRAPILVPRSEGELEGAIFLARQP